MMSKCRADPCKGMLQIFVGTVSMVMSSQFDGNGDIIDSRHNLSENRGEGSTVTVGAGYVKSLSVLLMPVLWLLMDGCNFRMSKAFIINNFSFYCENFELLLCFFTVFTGDITSCNVSIAITLNVLITVLTVPTNI